MRPNQQNSEKLKPDVFTDLYIIGKRVEFIFKVKLQKHNDLLKIYIIARERKKERKRVQPSHLFFPLFLLFFPFIFLFCCLSSNDNIINSFFF